MYPRKIFRLALASGATLTLGARTLVMGILNVSPDSFAEKAPLGDPGRAVEAALRLEAEGADIVDVGGESTRPGAEPLPEEVERERVMPVIRALRGRIRVPLSIDTYKAGVARAALDEGAGLVNDVSALRYDPALAEVVASRGAGLILMHNRGRSSDMYREAVYHSVAAEVVDELAASVRMAVGQGVKVDQIVVDPGIGFAKRAEHSLEVLARMDGLRALDRPILIGPSRKSFLRSAIGDMPAVDRDWGTAAAIAASVLFGAHIVRVHAVKEMVQVVRVADALRAAAGETGSGG